MKCRRAAFDVMAKVSSGYMLRSLFTAWLEDYKVTRRARHWFLEKGSGEGAESEEETEWYWPEGDDPISSLPRKIAVKVNSTLGTDSNITLGYQSLQIFGLVGIRALCSCARVCRRWKDISEDSHLWNKVS